MTQFIVTRHFGQNDSTADVIDPEHLLEHEDSQFFDTKNLFYNGINENFFNFHKNSILNEFYAEKHYMNSLTIRNTRVEWKRATNCAYIPVNHETLPVDVGDAVYLTRTAFPENHFKATIKSIMSEIDRVIRIEIKMNEIIIPSLIKYSNSEHGLFDLHFEVNKKMYKNILASLKLFCCNRILTKEDSTEKTRYPKSIEELLTLGNLQNNENHTICDSTKEVFDSLDNEQREGVEKCLSQCITIITGPPGCGKTKLLTAVVEQVYNSLENDEKILISCPTNIATDNIFRRSVSIAENLGDRSSLRLYGNYVDDRMLEYDSTRIMNELLRDNVKYNELQREVLTINEQLMTIDMNENLLNKRITVRNAKLRQIHSIEDHCMKELFKKAKIIATTCSMSGHTAVRNLKFKLVIIDEAFCAILPVILESVIKTQKHLVVCYDPKQLGPMLRSVQNVRHYDCQSTLEKLASSNVAFVLKNNYRLHKSFVSMIGKLTYGEEALIAMRPDLDNENIIFINIQTIEKNLQYSKYNEGEEDAVNAAISMLEKKNINHNEIVIISFYKASQMKLLHKFKDFAVKTVDSFQGQESKAIILVTTRSNEEKSIGFLKNQRRLNVGITRSSDYLVIIGNMDTLTSDYQFNEIISRAKHV